ncbi:very-long-chain (3R)-3-hydroxyacyl-CoA dehydratase [Malassezia equina]|uniref:Very-long-chain (3R)-3-hydroxyacyl-CoA dehydratase n=1 Tax=Malassezia equina TaxID=1381935 RepID=A0AAF0EKD4_9BASI|nr:very-long-chain (3R)-3-hydroxyacyl-CoA dehydratase [Malassezia equina]
MSAASAPSTRTRPVVTAYLVFYNLFSFVLWLRVFAGIVLYMLHGDSARKMVYSSVVEAVQRVLPAKVAGAMIDYGAYPPLLATILRRASSMHNYIGSLVVVAQSLAVLEVVHAAVGWVRSNPLITAVQVASRLIVVWCITEKYEAAAHSPFYALMVCAWSLSEIARYPFYVNQLLRSPSFISLWARYSAFIVLYPLGVLGETSLIYATLPVQRGWPWENPQAWSLRDLLFLALLPVYVPGLYMLYTRLLASRRKVLGPDWAGTKGRQEIQKQKAAEFERIRRLHEKKQ